MKKIILALTLLTGCAYVGKISGPVITHQKGPASGMACMVISDWDISEITGKEGPECWCMVRPIITRQKQVVVPFFLSDMNLCKKE